MYSGWAAAFDVVRCYESIFLQRLFCVSRRSFPFISLVDVLLELGKILDTQVLYPC